jgi:hypothetical protein
VRNNRREHLEAEDEVALLLGGIAALDRETEQALGVGIRRVDAERDRVRAAHGEHLISADLFRFETHEPTPGFRCVGYVSSN